jgi:hypothetical protein
MQDTAAGLIQSLKLDLLDDHPEPQLLESILRNAAELSRDCDSIQRAVFRSALIQALRDKKVPSPARLVDAALGGSPESYDEGSSSTFLDEPEPWPDLVNGNEILTEIENLLKRFFILPVGSTVVIALWIVHTYLFHLEMHSPYVAIRSAEKRSGKTNLMDFARPLVKRGIMTSSLTPAVAFRVIDQYSPSLLVDEFESITEELRLILNSGYRRGGNVPRCVGDDNEIKFFSTYSPKMFAGNKNRRIPDTLIDRSILIEMKRRSKDDPPIERFRSDRHEIESSDLKRKIIRWTNDHAEEVAQLDPPDLPELNDRQNDNWRPLLKIADVIGGDWPEKARQAAKLLSNVDGEDQSIGVAILQDIHDIFESRNVDRLASGAITAELAQLEERPWPEWKAGKPITERQLATLLKPFGIKPKQLKFHSENLRGYEREWFSDAFSRYLPASEVLPPLPSSNDAPFEPFANRYREEPGSASNNGGKPRQISEVAEVADKSEDAEEESIWLTVTVDEDGDRIVPAQ